MAYPGEIAKGDTVRWRYSRRDQEREGVVVRVARDGMWVDVRYPIEARIFPDVTHLTRRVPITLLHLVRKAGQP